MLADEAKVGSRRWRAVVAALGAVPFFVDVAPEELEEIALQLTLCRYAKGERIVTDGYTLAVLPLAAAPPKKQQTLF